MSVSGFTVQPSYYPARSASLFDIHVCAFSMGTFSFCAWLQIEPWGNRLTRSTCTGRKQSHNTAEEVKVGGVGGSQFYCLWKDVGEKSCTQNYFHLNHFCKLSHWIYTCLVNNRVASYQKSLSYYERLREEKGKMFESWKVKCPQRCVVFWQSLVCCLQGKVLEIRKCLLEAGMKEHGLITAQMCLAESAEKGFLCFHVYINRSFLF